MRYKPLLMLSIVLTSSSGFAASPLQVYDANNRIVGLLVQQNIVVIKLGTISVAAQASSAGFSVIDSSNIQFFHASTDCSGTRYLDASGLPEQAQTSNTTIYYAGTPTINLPVSSIEVFNSGANVDQPGQCVPFSGYSVQAGAVMSASLASLGFSPLFSTR